MTQKYLITASDVEEFKLIPDVVNDERINPLIVEAQDFDLRESLGYPLYNDLLNDYGNEQATLNYTGLSGTFAVAETISGGTGKTAVIVSKTTGQLIINTIVGDWSGVTTITGGTSGATAQKSSIVFGKYYNLMNGESYTDSGLNPVNFIGLRAALVYWTFARFIQVQQITITANGVVEKTNQYSVQATEKKIAQRITQARSGAQAYFLQAAKYLNDKNVSTIIYPFWLTGKTEKRSGGIKITSVNKFERQNTVAQYGTEPVSSNGFTNSLRYAPAVYTLLNTKSYTISQLSGATIQSVQLDNILLTPAQYTLSGTTFTFVDVDIAPAAGQYLLIGYTL